MNFRKLAESMALSVRTDSSMLVDELAARSLKIRGWLQASIVDSARSDDHMEKLVHEVKDLVNWASEMQVKVALLNENTDDGVAEIMGEQDAVEKDFKQRLAASELHDKSKPEVRQQVWALTEGRCAYCDIALEQSGTNAAAFVVEHVVPSSSGGPDNIANYVPACFSCNTSKKDGHVLTFIQRRFGRVKRTDLKVVQYDPERFGEESA